MERLTSREPRISGMPGVCCTHFEGGDCQAIQGHCADGCAWEEAAWERLAAYEDTGLKPEDIDALQKREQGLAEMLVNVSCGCAVPYTRLAELDQAEKDGRLMVLPVKEGAKIYRVRFNFDGNCYEIIEKDFDLGLFRPEDFGRIIFRTREEAEAALKKREATNETD